MKTIKIKQEVTRHQILTLVALVEGGRTAELFEGEVSRLEVMHASSHKVNIKKKTTMKKLLRISNKLELSGQSSQDDPLTKPSRTRQRVSRY